jgi:hypothetical protein
LREVCRNLILTIPKISRIHLSYTIQYVSEFNTSIMSIPIMERGNDAVNINPPTANRSLLVKGSNWLWAATAVMGIAFLSWLFWTLLRYRSRTATSHANNNGDNGVHKSHVWLWIEDTYLKYFGENRTSYGVKGKSRSCKFLVF